MKRLAAALIAAVLLAQPPAAQAAAGAVVASRTSVALAPGVSLTSFERLYPFGWVTGYLLDADLSHDGVSADLITASAVTAAEHLTEMATRSNAVAAVNGDFFDINNTKAPLGPYVHAGEILKSAPEGSPAAGVGVDRIGRLTGVLLKGSITTPYGTYPLASLNQYTVPTGGIGLYTSQWSVPIKGAAYGASSACEVVLKDSAVVSVATQVTAAPVAAGTHVLVGREDGAPRLCQLKPGDPVSVTYAASPDLRFAVGGGDVLVRDGQVQNLADKGYKPHSAIGFSADGKRMLLLTVDGRSEESGGVTLLELARLMKEFGAANAMELDGGGSAEMVARRAQQTGVNVVNHPSDGGERPVPNGVGIFVPKGSGHAVGLSVRPVSGSDRVFPGLTRRLEAAGYDEQMQAAAIAPPVWSGAEAGVFRAAAQGEAVVEAKSGSLSGTARLRVLGPLARIEFQPAGLTLEPGVSASVKVIGYDADGYSSPIEPADISLQYLSPDLVATPLSDGSLQVTLKQAGQAVMIAGVQGKTASLPVAAGTGIAMVTAFDTADGWRFAGSAAAVTGQAESAPGRTLQGLKLTYAFGIGGTRAAYAVGPVTLPGTPSALGLWVNADGKGAWLRAEVSDAKGTRRPLDLAAKVDWTGWRYLEAAIPSTLVPPIRLERIYPVETSPDKAYSGSLIFDDLQVKLPVALPQVPAPAPAPPDPMIANPVSGGWSFAVATTSGFATEQVKSAVAAGAELIILGGDAAHALPGELNAPIYRLTGGGHVDWKQTRFIGLDTAAGSLRTSNFGQLAELQSQLDAAATDPGVKAVVLVATAPPARYSDWREAGLVSRWLTDFRSKSGGKPVAYLAAAGQTLVRRYEGAAYVEIAGGGATGRIAADANVGALKWLSIAPWR